MTSVFIQMLHIRSSHGQRFSFQHQFILTCFNIHLLMSQLPPVIAYERQYVVLEMQTWSILNSILKFLLKVIFFIILMQTLVQLHFDVECSLQPLIYLLCKALLSCTLPSSSTQREELFIMQMNFKKSSEAFTLDNSFETTFFSTSKRMHISTLQRFLTLKQGCGFNTMMFIIIPSLNPMFCL